MSPLTILLRFLFGVILACVVALAAQLSAPLTIALLLGIGLAAAIWGDKFLLGLMALFRYFR
jgi:hypothetical protein